MGVEPTRFSIVIYTKVVPVVTLELEERRRMFALMQKYYDNVTWDEFVKDLDKKNAVIVLRDKQRGQIQGFSTLLHLNVNCDGVMHRGIFSGDTVVEKEYWGSRALGKAFLRHLFIEKAKKPFTPLYWLLITKGYKTYLLMANNVFDYYPRYERPTPPHWQNLIDAFYTHLYPEHYDRAKGVIEFAKSSCTLKQGVAAPSDELVAKNMRVAFFLSKNPDWKQGSELACLSKMSLLMPLYYAFKSLVKSRGSKQVMPEALSSKQT
jgi:hypothetical protein